jgi:hypothetical protein
VKATRCIWLLDCTTRSSQSEILWLFLTKIASFAIASYTIFKAQSFYYLDQKLLTHLFAYRQTQTSAGAVTRRLASLRSNAGVLMCSVRSIVLPKTTIVRLTTSQSSRRKLPSRIHWFRIRRWRRCSDSTGSPHCCLALTYSWSRSRPSSERDLWHLPMAMARLAPDDLDLRTPRLLFAKPIV